MSKRKLTIGPNDEPSFKKRKRVKMSSDDTKWIKDQLQNGHYVIIPYSEEDKNNYQYVRCVVDSSNQSLKYGKYVDSKRKNDYNQENHKPLKLSFGEEPYVFICFDCYYDEPLTMQIWKHNTSTRNFQMHQTSKHGLVLTSMQWTVAQRLQILRPSLEYVAWDRNSFNSVNGAGLRSLVTAFYNLGCQTQKKVNNAGGLLYSGPILSTKMRENGQTIEAQRNAYYVEYFGDFNNYPYDKHIECDMWKSIANHDYLNLIVRNYEDGILITSWEDLEEFNNVVNLSLKYAQNKVLERYQLQMEEENESKLIEQLNELKLVEDAAKKKADYKGKKQKNKKKQRNKNNSSEGNNNTILQMFNIDSNNDNDGAADLEITRDTLSDWFAPDRGHINWNMGVSEDEDDDNDDNDDDNGYCRLNEQENDETVLEIDDVELDNVTLDEGFTASIQNETEYKKTIKNIAHALIYMLKRIGFQVPFKLPSIEAEIMKVYPQFKILKINIHTDNAMKNIDDWITWLFQVFCMNHNLMLAILNAIKTAKKKSKRLRLLFKIMKKLIAFINKSNKNKYFDPKMISCNDTRWRLLCEAFLRSCFKQNNANLRKIADANDFREFHLFPVSERYQIGIFLRDFGDIHDVFERSDIGNSHQVIPQAHYVMAEVCCLKLDIRKRPASHNGRTFISHQYLNGKYRIPIQYININDEFERDEFAHENNFTPHPIDYATTKLLKKCLSSTMLSTFINKIEMKHWMSLFLCGPFRDFDEVGYRFLNGVKPKGKAIINTKKMYSTVIKQVKQDIVNVLIFDKYCEWKGLYHTGNKSCVNERNSVTHTLDSKPSKPRRKSTVSNLLRLRKRKISVSSLNMNALNISEDEISELSSECRNISELSLNDVLTKEFIATSMKLAKDEVDFYLSIDFDEPTDETIAQYLSKPLLVFEEKPLIDIAPILSKRIAPYYLNDLDSEASSEEQFSDAGFTCSDIRSLLHPTTLRALQLERMKYLRARKKQMKANKNE